MYKPSDVEILEAYDDFLSEALKTGHVIIRSEIWLEAFKRGMRFNPDASRSVVETDECTCQKPNVYDPLCPVCGTNKL